MNVQTNIFKLAANLGASLVKATAITLISQLAASEMRSIAKEVNEKIVQNIRYIRNMQHANNV